MRYVKQWSFPYKVFCGGTLCINDHDPQFLGIRGNCIHYTIDPDKPVSVKAFYTVKAGDSRIDLVPLNIPENTKLVGQIECSDPDEIKNFGSSTIRLFFLFEQL